MQSLANNLKIDEKSKFLTEFWDLRRAVISQKYVTGGILMCQGQRERLAPPPKKKKPVKHGIFPVLTLLSTRPSLEPGTPKPTKILF